MTLESPDANLLFYISFAILLLGVLFLLVFLVNRLRRLVLRARRKKVQRISLAENTSRFIVILFWITLSLAGMLLGAFMRAYDSFTREELVAVVRCVQVEDQTMLFEMDMANDGQDGPVQQFKLNGDQWAVEGDILKWSDWLNFTGLHTMYKLNRVRGRYVSTREETSRSPSVYSLTGTEDNPVWRWLYKFGYQLPFVNAVYGNTVFTYPSRDRVFEVYVTTSGFIVKIRQK